MTKKRRIQAWIIGLCLCVGLLVPSASAASDLYFTSINDTLLPLTSETMPYRSSGVLYVPYTVFDSNSSGVSLGISCIYNRSHNTVILYNTEQVLTFYLETGVCYDEMTGDTYSKRAMLRNGIPFVALDTVCLFFELNYTYNLVPKISQAYLVRVKDKDVVLSDSKFIDAAGDLISRRYQSYLQSLPPAVETDTPTAPAPSTGEKPPEVHEVPTNLAFLCDGSESVSALLDILSRNRTYGLFFVTPELIERDDGLIRRILGTGHSVGIWARGADLESSQKTLEEGNRMLERLTYSRTTIVYAPREQRAVLEDNGWVCWDESLLLDPSSTVGASYFASQTLKQISNRSQRTYLTLACDTDAVRVLPTLLDQLAEMHFVVDIPLETWL